MMSIDQYENFQSHGGVDRRAEVRQGSFNLSDSNAKKLRRQ